PPQVPGRAARRAVGEPPPGVRRGDAAVEVRGRVRSGDPHRPGAADRLARRPVPWDPGDAVLPEGGRPEPAGGDAAAGPAAGPGAAGAPRGRPPAGPRA